MKKTIFIIFLVAASMVLFMKCEDEPSFLMEAEMDFPTTDNRDKALEDASLIIRDALKNEEFTSLLRQQLYADDNYSADLAGLSELVMLKDQVKVKDFLNNRYMGNTSHKLKSSPFSSLDSLIANHPDIEMVLAVNAEDWDGTESPIIVVRPLRFSMDEEFIKGYDKDGNEVIFSTNEDPDVPVLVVRHMEKGKDKPKHKKGLKSSPMGFVQNPVSTIKLKTECTEYSKPAAPSNCATRIVQNSVEITWNDNSSNESSFTIRRYNYSIGAYDRYFSISKNSTLATDPASQLDSNRTYAYTVRANNCKGSSGYSNNSIITTPAFPDNIPTNLEVESTGSNTGKVTWHYPSTDNTLDYFKIIRVHDQEKTVFDYVPRADRIFWDNGTDKTPGYEYFYYVRAVNAWGQSIESNCDVMVNSGRSNNESLYVTHVKVLDINAIEKWYDGPKVELQCEVWSDEDTINDPEKDGIKVIDWDLQDRTRNEYSSGVPFNKEICKWSCSFYKSIMNFHMLEVDGNDNGQLLADLANMAIKKLINDTEIVEYCKKTIKIHMDVTDKDCGYDKVYFWEPYNTTIRLSGAGDIVIRLSNQPDYDAWDIDWENDDWNWIAD